MIKVRLRISVRPIPLFPSDALTLVLGLTEIRYRTFIILLIIGHIPRYLIINALGENFLIGFNLKTILALLLAILIIFLVIFFKRTLKRIHDRYFN